MQDDKNAVYQMRFPQKLWYLLNLSTDAILWGGTGKTILLNYRILHNYLQCDNSIFKTTNISSFVRQLNLYGFRKVTSHLQDPLCNSSNPFMHEYIHDFFQFGRPELLHKITRKALTIKKTFRTKDSNGNADRLLNMTPLQKARRTLRLALSKAAEDNMFFQNTSNPFSFKFDCDESPDDLCDDEDSIEIEWPDIPSPNKEPEILPKTESSKSETTKNQTESFETSGSTPHESWMNFNDSSQNANDNFCGQFLSMPELDTEPLQDKSTETSSADFNLTNKDIFVKNLNRMDSEQNSLNCVLPSVGKDQNDDIINEFQNSQENHYNGEWDQMLNEFMVPKSSSQDHSSELKDIYSQISKTIDLLNS